jgi:quinol monooxygenase YgiN
MANTVTEVPRMMGIPDTGSARFGTRKTQGEVQHSMPRDREFVVIWEFRVLTEARERFEHQYGPLGEWAALFAQSPDYLRTELVHDAGDGLRFLTLDHWKSREAYERFRQLHAEEYKAIDTRCEVMTESEREIGRFLRED